MLVSLPLFKFEHFSHRLLCRTNNRMTITTSINTSTRDTDRPINNAVLSFLLFVFSFISDTAVKDEDGDCNYSVNPYGKNFSSLMKTK